MEKEYLQQLLKEKLSTHQISLKIGKGQTTVRYWLRKYNLSTDYKPFTKKEFIGTTSFCKKHGLTEYNEKIRCIKCAKEAVSDHRRKIKLKAIEYKGGKCLKCGYTKCSAALEFHHLDPSKKDFHLSKNGYNLAWEKYKKELDKCILVCSNCHKEIHYNKGV